MRVHPPTHGHFVHLLMWIRGRHHGPQGPVTDKVVYGVYSSEDAAEYERSTLLREGVITDPQSLYIEAQVVR